MASVSPAGQSRQGRGLLAPTPHVCLRRWDRGFQACPVQPAESLMALGCLRKGARGYLGGSFITREPAPKGIMPGLLEPASTGPTPEGSGEGSGGAGVRRAGWGGRGGEGKGVEVKGEGG